MSDRTNSRGGSGVRKVQQSAEMFIFTLQSADFTLKANDKRLSWVLK